MSTNKEQIQIFVNQSLKKFLGGRQWLEFEKGKVYLRVAKRNINGEMRSCIDLSSIEANEMRKGFFTETLQIIEEVAKENGIGVFVENVLHNFLCSYLEKRQYTLVDDFEDCKCYFKTF